MRTRMLSLGAAVCLAVGISACGGDDDALSDDSVAAIDQIGEICDDWRQKLDERGDFPVKDFDPEDPDPADLRTVGQYFASGQSTAESAIAELRDLAVPTEIEAKVDALVGAMERAFQAQKTQHAAAQAGDVAAFKATLNEAASTNLAVKNAADDLSVEQCSF